MRRSLRVLIVDDEPLAVRRLEMGLAGIPGAEAVGSASNAQKAAEAIDRLAPDVLLLDIRMPGLDGLQFVETLDPTVTPAVIFVTAYSRFAVDAFKVAAVDYLLKPVEFPRLAEALDRAREVLDARAARNLRPREKPAGDPAQPPAYSDELWIQSRGARHRLAAEHIDWIQAERDYVRVHAAGRTHLIRRSIQALTRDLDPAAFVRVHRSALVRLDQVTSLARNETGALCVVLRSGATVTVARRHAAALRARLGGRA
jgi:two-component system, LytTR family, response regulator